MIRRLWRKRNLWLGKRDHFRAIASDIISLVYHHKILQDVWLSHCYLESFSVEKTLKLNLKYSIFRLKNPSNELGENKDAHKLSRRSLRDRFQVDRVLASNMMF